MNANHVVNYSAESVATPLTLAIVIELLTLAIASARPPSVIAPRDTQFTRSADRNGGDQALQAASWIQQM